MKLLFDQNLSRFLVEELDQHFPGSRHVSALGLDSSTDDEIWDYAKSNGYVIVSKDSDFRQLAFLHGPPPKFIWLRVGNVSTEEICRVIIEYRDSIERFGVGDGEALLPIPERESPFA